MDTMKSLDFERSLSRLEEVVGRLEQGDLPLEEGLTAFEEGMALARHCQQRLDAAQKRIEELTAASSRDGLAAG
ncbi:MAG: exodeoxyribonuclease VII small subunit [Magnetococcales bacterium]|nr:exodeoxyribonuclease VII small subunit [Magnetococcales bacterium]